MIIPFKKRRLSHYEPVEVYRNLNKNGIWYSVRQGGKVIGHATEISLKDVIFHVNEKGRKRVKKTGRRNVHAWVKGHVTDYAEARWGKEMTRIIYDPKLYKSFVTWKDLKKVKQANSVVLYSGGLIAHLKESKKKKR